MRTALEAGARWIVLCDTNGGTMPSEIEEIVTDVLSVAPGDRLGIHAHDDTGQAVANSLAAVRAGVRHIQGTLNGLGERCGNANLVTLIPTLVLKPVFAERLETGITVEKLKTLTHVSRVFDEILNRAPYRQAPYVGAAAFATKAGIHASALAKDPSTYEHVPPESVGNERAVMVSQQAGKSNLLTALARFGIDLAKDDPRLDKMLRQVKERSAGYSMTGPKPRSSFSPTRCWERCPFSSMSRAIASASQRAQRKGRSDHRLRGGGQDRHRWRDVHVGAEGNARSTHWTSPCADLGKYSQRIDDLELVDFKVRILDGGTGAITRVLIESSDGTGERCLRWASPNIIDAPFEALYESLPIN